VEHSVQELLRTMLPLVRVDHTEHLPFDAKQSVYDRLAQERTRIRQDLEAGAEDVQLGKGVALPDDAYEYFNMMIRPDMKDKPFRVSVTYSPEWGMLFDVQPRDGNRMTSSNIRMAQLLRFLCINQWHFTYDITYPALVRILDPKSGFTFQYALPVSIDDNTAVARDTTLHTFQGIPESVGFCEQTGSDQADIRALGDIDGSGMNVELADANITFQCLTKECLLGKTQADEQGYRLFTLLPQGCKNPLITVQHEGYLPATRQLTGDRLDIPVKKVRALPVTIVKHTYGVDGLFSQGEPLEKFEKVAISLIVKGEDDDQYLDMGSIPDGVAHPTLSFVEGDQSYDLTAYLRDDFGTMYGGYYNANLTISGSEIRNAQGIAIHVFRYTPTPTSEEDKQKMTTILFDGNYKEEYKPAFT